MSNFIYYEKLEDYEEQVRKAKLCDEKDKEIERLKEEYMTLQNASDEVEEEKDKEIERLNNDIKELLKENSNKEKVIKIQDNIINEFDKWLLGEKMMFYKSSDGETLIRFNETTSKWLELKGSDKE